MFDLKILLQEGFHRCRSPCCRAPGPRARPSPYGCHPQLLAGRGIKEGNKPCSLFHGFVDFVHLAAPPACTASPATRASLVSLGFACCQCGSALHGTVAPRHCDRGPGRAWGLRHKGEQRHSWPRVPVFLREGRWEAAAAGAGPWAEPAAGNGDGGVTWRWRCRGDALTAAARALASPSVCSEAAWLNCRMRPCQAVPAARAGMHRVGGCIHSQRRGLRRGVSARWPHGSRLASPTRRPDPEVLPCGAWSAGATGKTPNALPAPCRLPQPVAWIFWGFPWEFGALGRSATSPVSPEQWFALGSTAPCPLAVKVTTAAWGHEDVSVVGGKARSPPRPAACPACPSCPSCSLPALPRLRPKSTF